jgi:uncharacterized protein (TIGR03118 family)
MNCTAQLCPLALIAWWFAVSPLTAAPGYVVHKFVADQPGAADFTDSRLINAWGIAISGTSPLWVCDGGSGFSTVYSAGANGFSISPVTAAIPPSSTGGNTVCTGIVFNSSSAFLMGSTNPRPASFIFATEGGTISAWANAVDPTHALMMVDNSAAGAVYKGLAIVTTGSEPRLYAANFHSGSIDVFDGNFKPVSLPGAFSDPAIPPGFAPFNIQNLGGKLYVTYAKQDADKRFDVPGVGNGYVAVYDSSGALLKHLVSGGPLSLLNSPWGVQIAPSNFGIYSGALLVGNFGDGLIHAYDLSSGAFLGTLQDQNGVNIQIPYLWGLQFGNGGNGGDTSALFFAAGPSSQRHGLLGSIQANPVVSATSIVSAANPASAIAPNTWVSLSGANLAPAARSWTAADLAGGKLPTSLSGVSVTVDGVPAYLSLVSPKLINFLTPVGMHAGASVQIVVSNSGLTSDPIAVQSQPVAPSFLLLGGKYVAALHSDNKTIIGPPTLASGSSPAKPGETIVLFGTGFGATNPPAPEGQPLTQAANLAASPAVRIGGADARVVYAGLTGTGLYQINVVVPPSAADGDLPVTVSIGGATSPGGAFLTVQH